VVENMTEEISRVLHWTRSKIKESYDDYRIRCLITDAYSSRQSTRLLARAKLKKEYPEIYAEIEEVK